MLTRWTSWVQISYRVVKMVEERLKANAVPIQLPIGKEDTFVGIIDLVEMKAEIYKDDLGKEYENDRYS